MRLLQFRYPLSLHTAGLLVFLMMSCGKEEEKVQKPLQPVNTFRMLLNGREWTPSALGEDKCLRAYHASRSTVTHGTQVTPYYSISAFNDSAAPVSGNRVNSFFLQISGVETPGRFPITGNYREFYSSHAWFVQKQPDGSFSRYVNRQNPASMEVTISRMIPLREGWTFQGIEGAFEGVLYNETNPQDSLSIERGEFTFAKMNWYNFNQCPQ